jgi:hypothetical protein
MNEAEIEESSVKQLAKNIRDRYKQRHYTPKN